ncbi:hypothetical protein Tsubulata_002542 [Turnera subulata]|uniref:Uncharacterized protein n=1 Tax=Turnera subulata TaxID=218843 RepID=A0A9Q0GA39_9ROSI|nr:hypothetical protein Tsubulata_002542 [Turnera subulata]
MANAATSGSFLRATRRLFSSSAASHHNNHQQTHKFLERNSFIGSWEAPKTPEEAQAKLAMLRRQYAKQVKAVRKEYIAEMEMMRIEKQRKEEARKEALRAANEERRKLKAEAAKVRAQERQIALEEFRQTLSKERAEKLENWRMKEQEREGKKKAKIDLLHRQSSMWVDENKLESVLLVKLSS